MAGSFDSSTDWFSPVQPTEQQTWVDPKVAAHAAQPTASTSAVGLLDRPGAPGTDPRMPVAEQTAPGALPARENYPADDHPSIPPGTLDITPQDIYDVLGPDAEDMLATAEINVDEVIRLINAETTVLPPLNIPDAAPTGDRAEEPQRQAIEDDVVEDAATVWKRRFLKGAVTAVLVSLTGTGGAAAAMDKSVTVEVDGQEHSVNTYESTVGEVLQDEGIDVGRHDALSPSPQAQVSHGDTITLDRGRLVQVNVDGEPREEWVRSATVGQALQQMGVPTDAAKVSVDESKPVPENGIELSVKTSKNITVVDGAGEPDEVTTHAVTVDELLREQNMQLGPQDEITPNDEGKITDGAEIQINRTDSKVVSESHTIDPPVREIVDDNMFKGEEHVEKPGKPGEKIVFNRITTHNGDESDRETVDEKVKTKPEPRVLRVGGKEPPNSEVWDKLAECEAGGDWSTSSGNGYYGGLQFDKSTWDAYDGDQHADYPHQASREQQISVASKMRDERGGYGAWPSCSAEIGAE